MIPLPEFSPKNLTVSVHRDLLSNIIYNSEKIMNNHVFS